VELTEFLISKLAADLDTTNEQVLATSPIMDLVNDYLANSDLTYEQLLTKANMHKQLVRR
jgi:hypothetical protein